MRPLGRRMLSSLRCMVARTGLRASTPPGTMHVHCGWTWGSPAENERIARALEARGLVVEIDVENEPEIAVGPAFRITDAGRMAVLEYQAHAWNDLTDDEKRRRAEATEAARKRHRAEQRDFRLRGDWGSWKQGGARDALERIASGALNDPVGFAQDFLERFGQETDG